MLTMNRGVAKLVVVGAVSVALTVSAGQPLGLPGAPDHQLSSDGQTVAAHSYSESQIEFYLSDEEKSYVRPGLTVEIVGVEIPADRHTVVEVTYVDDQGLPLDREGRLTPGDISMSFVIAWYDGGLRQYTAYTTRIAENPDTGETAVQATSDSGGTWEDLELGRSRYTFGTQLPEGYDMTRTHTVYVYGTRNTAEILGKNYYSDPTYDFRPDGGDVTERWASIFTETCNTCHDPLALHGSRRRSIRGCITCHSPQSTDPDSGNTVDMKVMIHKIHRGAFLPSVQAGMPYFIVGFRGSVHDYSDVVFPQDIRNCWNCHSQEAPDGSVWFTYPARASCGSCHDDINWETGENHAGGPASSDDFCAACHPPQGDREFDASVIGAHTIPTKSSQLAGLNMEIVDITDVAPGSHPTVTFKVSDDAGMAVDITTLNRMRLRWGGPTVEYVEDFQEDAFDAVMSGDVYIKTLTEPIPENATGTWGFSADVYQNVTIEDGTADGREVREAAFNPIFYASVTDDMAVPRREVVNLDNCNRCHDVLSLHGGQRFRIEECLICHRPDGTDADDRPEEEFPPESVHFKYMIHRIHTGAFLARDYTVYGFGGNPHNYNEVVYPGDRRNCEGCHYPGTYGVPTPEGSLETPTLRDWYTPMQPASAACVACHSSVDAAAHAYINTAPFGESCAACHGADREFSVERVHAR